MEKCDRDADEEKHSIVEWKNKFKLEKLKTILRGFVDNCCIAVFEDYRTEDKLNELIAQLPNCHEKKEIKTLLVILTKRNRFIYNLEPDYSGKISDIKCLAEQSEKIRLDMIILQQTNKIKDNKFKTETTSLEEYDNTEFEKERRKLSSYGYNFREKEYPENFFLDVVFGKMIKYVQRIDVIDKLFGTQFSGNFEYSAEKFIEFLSHNLANPKECKELIFHCRTPAGFKDNHIKEKLSEFKRKALIDVPIKVKFYGPKPTKENSVNVNHYMPHHRYVITDQIAISIDRGMDFLIEKEKRNRNTNVKYENSDEIFEQINLSESNSSITI